jgi:hypothetical protein
VGSYGVTFIDFALLGIFIVFAKRLIWDGDKLEFHFHPAIFFLLAMPVAALLSGLTPLIKGSTPQMIQYFKTSAHFLFLVSFTLICTFYKIETKTWTNVIRAWLIISIFINVFGVYQIFARAYDLPLAWIQFTNVSLAGRASDNVEDIKQLSLRYGDFFRATSIFTEPSALASFNVLIQIFLIVPFVQKRKPFIKSKIINTLVYSFSLISLFLAFSMTGFVGLGLVLGTIFIFHRSKRLRAFFVVFAISIILIFTTDRIIENFSGVSVADLFGKRLSGILFGTQKTEGESIGVRLRSGKIGIEIWEEHFINGTGLGLTSYNNRKHVEFGDFSTTAALAEMGLIGFLAFVGLFVTLFIVTYKMMLRMRNKDNLPDDLKRLSGILFYLMLHQLLINFISGNNLVTFVLWIFLGVIFANINQIAINQGQKIYEIAFLRTPMKILLNQGIKSNLNNKND